MANQDLLNAFNDCIDRLGQGQAIEECLRRYPQYAPTLRPMLETSQIARQIRVSPVEVAQVQERGRYRFEEAIRLTERRRGYPIYRLASLAAMILIICAAVSAGTNFAAQSSLPGDGLYGLKLFGEQLRLSFNPGLTGTFNQERIAEIQQLLDGGRGSEVIFRGEVMAINGEEWAIEGLLTQVLAGTPGAASALIGDTVEVHAYTTPESQLIATSIMVIVTHQPTPTTTQPPTLVPTAALITPAASATVTSQPTSTSMPTASATLTPSATPSATISPTVSATASLTPTASPTTCVATPPPGWEIYRIQAGDSLFKLATNRGISLSLLLSVNCLTDPNFIVVGQVIYLPALTSTISASPTPTPIAGESGGQGDNNNNNSNSNDNGSNGGNNNNSNDNNDNNDNGDDHGGHGGNGGGGGN